jgi:hypothetical protein
MDIRDAWTFPVPGITGWADRTEGPRWVFHSPLVPYCVFVNPGMKPNKAAANQVLPCRYTPGFHCCRWGFLGFARRWSCHNR